MSDKRRVKFKTLDNQVNELEVQQNISILNLKKLIMLKHGMPLESQRLIFQGKQLKNEQLLSDYIKEDDQTIHLMFLTPEQIETLNQQSLQRTSTQPQEQLQPLQSSSNINSTMNSASIVSMLHNMMNSNTSIPVQNMFIGPPLLQQHQRQPQAQARGTQPNPYPSILNRQSNYPISTSTTDVRYNDLLHGINSNLDLLSRNLNQEAINSSSAQASVLPITDSVQNILTAVSRSLRYYNDNMTQFIPQLNRLTDLLEKEALIANSEERNKGNEVLKQCSTSLDLISQSSLGLNQVISNANFGTAPNTGFVNVVNTEIGLIASMVLPSNQPTSQDLLTNNTTALSQSDMNNVINQRVQTSNEQIIDQNDIIQTCSNSNDNNQQNNHPVNDMPTSNSINQSHNQSQPEPWRSTQKGKPDEVLNKILKDPQLKGTILLKDTSSVIPLKPHPLFDSFVNKILRNMTFEEIANLSELNFTGFSKKLNIILPLVSSANKVNLLPQIMEFLIDSITIKENATHKKKANSVTDIQSIIKKYTILLFEVLFQTNIQTLAPAWENSMRDLLMSCISELYINLSHCYNSANEGFLYCLIKNTEKLVESILGEDWLNALNKYDSNLISKAVEEVVNLSLRHIQPKTGSSRNSESFPLMNINDILEVASKDQERISGPALPKTTFSDVYNNSSLFKD